MAIGLFLDVDNTLTQGFIQSYYATELGCLVEYERIETGFGKGILSPAQFGQEIINLFAGRGLTSERASEIYGKVQTQDWVREVFNLPADHYLVSSGPNYFIDKFAEDHGIPPTRVRCSNYRFGGEDGRIDSCVAMTDNRKADFVRGLAHKYDLTIGVGDSPSKDGPFLRECTVPIIVGSQSDSSFFSITSFDDLSLILKSLTARKAINRGTWPPSSKPRCFVGSSSEARMVARALVGAGLTEFCAPALWEYAFPASTTTIEALEREVDRCHFAVLVIEPDDVLDSRGERWGVPRDNVVFELGLFMGSLGRDRVFLVSPSGVQIKVPSDLSGVTRVNYAPAAPGEDLRNALITAVDEIRRAVAPPDLEA